MLAPSIPPVLPQRPISECLDLIEALLNTNAPVVVNFFQKMHSPIREKFIEVSFNPDKEGNYIFRVTELRYAGHSAIMDPIHRPDETIENSQGSRFFSFPMTPEEIQTYAAAAREILHATVELHEGKPFFMFATPTILNEFLDAAKKLGFTESDLEKKSKQIYELQLALKASIKNIFDRTPPVLITSSSTTSLLPHFTHSLRDVPGKTQPEVDTPKNTQTITAEDLDYVDHYLHAGASHFTQMCNPQNLFLQVSLKPEHDSGNYIFRLSNLRYLSNQKLLEVLDYDGKTLNPRPLEPLTKEYMHRSCVFEMTPQQVKDFSLASQAILAGKTYDRNGKTYIEFASQDQEFRFVEVMKTLEFKADDDYRKTMRLTFEISPRLIELYQKGQKTYQQYHDNTAGRSSLRSN